MKSDSKNSFIGTLSVSSKGVGYLEPEEARQTKTKGRDKSQDLEIQPDRLHTAMHGDNVEVKPAPRDPRSPRPQGEVVKIISRAKSRFVGVIESEKGKYFLIPDDYRMYRDFEIVKNSDGTPVKDLPVQTKALVEMIEWTEGKNPTCKLIEIIGKKGDNTAEMHSIVLEKGFETGFPADVEREAEEIDRTQKPIPASEIAKRRDMRDTLTFTIDPHDAKDFDDAISIKKLPATATEPELFEIGVHIADVSHYVRPGTALDREASKRAFSVYLVDRTIPMLPEVLSNDICSLNPHEDRLVFSAVFTMNTNGEILKRWFGKTVMYSAHRFTYETAQAVLEDKTEKDFILDPKLGRAVAKSHTGVVYSLSGAKIGDGAKYKNELVMLNKIAQKLQEQKFAAGAIDFEKEEVKFELEAGTGKPLRVIVKHRLDTHKLVEEYMLLANREVAHFVHHEEKKKQIKNSSLLYRIHDLPDPERLSDLATFIKALGYDLESHDGVITSKAIKKMLISITGSPHESLIRTATIRSMAKAIYSTKNVGHFGLAFSHYAHFTSPIRRYPDLLVHRVLQHHLEGGGHISENELAFYEKMAIKSSDQEVMAAEAERSSIKYKQVEYMLDKVGQEFNGTITGVTQWGMYVEENETKCEGMIKLRDLGDDFYVLDEKNYRLVGEQKKKVYTLGDGVRFKVVGADMERKVLDFTLVK